MKLTKISTIAALALGGLLAMTTMVSAQDATQGKRKGKQTIEQQMERYSTELSLTDEQKPKFKTVLEEMTKKRREIAQEAGGDRAAMREKMTALNDETEKKLKEFLKPEQLEKYKKIQEEQRKRGKGGGGGGGTGGTSGTEKKN